MGANNYLPSHFVLSSDRGLKPGLQEHSCWLLLMFVKQTCSQLLLSVQGAIAIGKR